jgi:hypothetical protein
MSTVVPFLPSSIRKFSFPAQLDNSQFTIDVTWNVSSQRYFINVYTVSGEWVLTTALVATPPGRAVNSVNYNQFRGVLTVEMVDPTLWPVPLSPGGLATKPGTIIDYTLEGFQPNDYNGQFRGMHINEITFEIPMPIVPNPLAITGSVSRYMDMIGTVFETSTLIYRNGAFEIGP